MFLHFSVFFFNNVDSKNMFVLYSSIAYNMNLNNFLVSRN